MENEISFLRKSETWEQNNLHKIEKITYNRKYKHYLKSQKAKKNHYQNK